MRTDYAKLDLQMSNWKDFAAIYALGISSVIFATEADAKEVLPQQNCDIYFEHNSYFLTPEAIDVLNDLAYDFRLSQPAKIFINGYTDRTGRAAYNLALSKKRAFAVGKYLGSALHSRKYRLIIKWFGENNLPFPTKDGVSEPFNRCVKVSSS